MIAVLLAGGLGSRLGQTSRFMPKSLIYIGTQPVINHIIDKLLNLPGMSKIYVLVDRNQRLPGSNNGRPGDLFDVETLFNHWKEVWYPDEGGYDEVKLVFEEDLPQSTRSNSGAIHGLYRFLLWMQKGTPLVNKSNQLLREPPVLDINERIWICAADNFWEDELNGLLEESKYYPKAIINAYYDFGDKEKIRRKYGAVALKNNWIAGYEEKPVEPKSDQTNASTAIYIYPYGEFEKLADYMQLDNVQYPVDAPGNLLKWFVLNVHPASQAATDRKHELGEGVRGYKLKGRWFDIGTRSDLMTAIIWHARKSVSSLETVADLKLAQQTEYLDDKYYFLCHRMQVISKERRIVLYFQSQDPICKLDSNSPGHVISVSEVRRRSKQADYWPDLHRAFEAGTDFPMRDLSSPLLISSGVFFLDSTPPVLRNGHSWLSSERTLLPLLEKDAGAPVDAGRLTTPAGRVDILDLVQTSFSEMAEEMIFYGASKETEQPTIYCCAPPELTNIKQKTLRRILDKRIQIPEIDPTRIREQANFADEEIALVEIIQPTTVVLPSSWAWSVEMYLDGEPQAKSENVILIPDQDNATLEFRFICTADLTGLHSPAAGNKRGRRVGKLMGIADGDNYGRRVFLFKLSEICNYYNDMHRKDATEILDYLFQSQHDSVTALAVTDGQTGRFAQFEAKMPALTFTTSVRRLVELLNELNELT